MQWQPENDVGMGDSYVRNMRGEERVWQTPKTIGKIINKIDNLRIKDVENEHIRR